MVEDIMKEKNPLEQPSVPSVLQTDIKQTDESQLDNLQNKDSGVTKDTKIINANEIAIPGCLKPEDEDSNDIDQIVDRTSIVDFHISKQKSANKNKDTRVFETRPPVFARPVKDQR